MNTAAAPVVPRAVISDTVQLYAGALAVTKQMEICAAADAALIEQHPLSSPLLQRTAQDTLALQIEAKRSR